LNESDEYFRPTTAMTDDTVLFAWYANVTISKSLNVLGYFIRPSWLVAAERSRLWTPYSA